MAVKDGAQGRHIYVCARAPVHVYMSYASFLRAYVYGAEKIFRERESPVL